MMIGALLVLILSEIRSKRRPISAQKCPSIAGTCLGAYSDLISDLISNLIYDEIDAETRPEGCQDSFRRLSGAYFDLIFDKISTKTYQHQPPYSASN